MELGSELLLKSRFEDGDSTYRDHYREYRDNYKDPLIHSPVSTSKKMRKDQSACTWRVRGTKK